MATGSKMVQLGYIDEFGATAWNRVTWAIIIANLNSVDALRGSVAEEGRGRRNLLFIS